MSMEDVAGAVPAEGGKPKGFLAFFWLALRV